MLVIREDYASIDTLGVGAAAFQVLFSPYPRGDPIPPRDTFADDLVHQIWPATFRTLTWPPAKHLADADEFRQFWRRFANLP